MSILLHRFRQAKWLNTDSPAWVGRRVSQEGRGLWVRSARRRSPGLSTCYSWAQAPCRAGGWPLQAAEARGLPLTTSLPFRHTPRGTGPACMTGWASRSRVASPATLKPGTTSIGPASPAPATLRPQETRGPQATERPTHGSWADDLASSETCDVYRSWRYCRS